jgi:ketosteroid isomerase-like protein
MELRDWVESYARAWRECDAEAAAALFTEDGTYRSHAFREPHVGHDGVRAYWTEATSTQRDVEVEMGEPFADGDRVAVEFWTRLLNDGEPVTLTGCLLLRFAADGRCAALREYWFVEPGLHRPHDGWGG